MRRQTLMKAVWFLVFTFLVAPMILAVFVARPGGNSYEAGKQAGRAAAPLMVIFGTTATRVGLKFGILPGTRD